MDRRQELLIMGGWKEKALQRGLDREIQMRRCKSASLSKASFQVIGVGFFDDHAIMLKPSSLPFRGVPAAST